MERFIFDANFREDRGLHKLVIFLPVNSQKCSMVLSGWIY